MEPGPSADDRDEARDLSGLDARLISFPWILSDYLAQIKLGIPALM
jgi:hypothetical protein